MDIEQLIKKGTLGADLTGILNSVNPPSLANVYGEIAAVQRLVALAQPAFAGEKIHELLNPSGITLIQKALAGLGGDYLREELAGTKSILRALEAGNSARHIFDALRPELYAMQGIATRAQQFASLGTQLTSFAATLSASSTALQWSAIADATRRFTWDSSFSALACVSTQIHAAFSRDIAELWTGHTKILDLISKPTVSEDALARLFPISAKAIFSAEDHFETIWSDVTLEADVELGKERARSEIDEQFSGAETRSRARIDPQLVSLWDGARTAVVSKTPDNQRHFFVSVRELTTQVLHALAPDEKVGAWPDPQKEFDRNGRPTRKTRLNYIYRRTRTPEFEAFLSKEISSFLALIDLYQEGTHGIEERFDETQLRVIVRRAESALVSLIEVSEFGG